LGNAHNAAKFPRRAKSQKNHSEREKIMAKFTKIALVSALAVAAASGNAWSASRSAAENAHVKALIRLMDADKNGAVSKEEFMQFMSAEFDRLDTDKSGGLTHEELSHSYIYGGGSRTSPTR